MDQRVVGLIPGQGINPMCPVASSISCWGACGRSAGGCFSLSQKESNGEMSSDEEINK